MILVVAWLRAFALTLAIEELVVLAMTREVGMPAPKRGALVAFANLATHPAVWFIVPLAFATDGTRVVVSEVWAVAIEAAFYAVTMRLPVARAVAVSAIANAASFGVGLVVRGLTGWV